MIEGLISGLILFLCTITAYILGIKQGKALGRGNTPKGVIESIKGDIKGRKEVKEVEKIKNIDDVYFRNFLDYTGEEQEDPAKESV